jgi:hypothetical protein
MTTPTLPPYALAAQDYLAARCRAATLAGDPFTAPVTTRELVDAIDPAHETFKAPRWTGLRQLVLEPLAAADLAAGRPYLAALVRKPRGWAPTDGFWTNTEGTMPDVPEDQRLTWWEGQITAAVAVWGTATDAAVEDALETFTADVAAAVARLRAAARRRLPEATPKTCPGCGIELPLTGRCDDC